MSKLRCRCGNEICDQTDHLPYKAYLLPDGKYSAFFDLLTEAADSLAVAMQKAELESWLSSHGFGDEYPRDQSFGGILHDFMHGFWCDAVKDCYECTVCGRVQVQSALHSDRFEALQPESGAYQGLLCPVSK